MNHICPQCRDEVSSQDLVSHIWLQSIERQDHLLLIVEPRLEPFGVCQTQCEEFFIAVQQISHRPLRDGKTSLEQFFMDLWDAALLLIAQRPYKRNQIQPKLPREAVPIRLPLRVVSADGSVNTPCYDNEALSGGAA